MTAVAAVLTTNREEALSIDLHLAERQLVEAERVRHAAIRRMHQAEEDAQTYKDTLTGVQKELIALRLRERELEATKALYLFALGRVAPGVHPSKIPDRPNGERFLVVRVLTSALGRRVGQAGSLVNVDRVGRSGALLTLEFADGGRDRLLPWELVRLDA